MKKGNVVVIQDMADNQTAIFQCITYKQFMAHKSHYSKMRSPNCVYDIMKGGYLIIDSPDLTHWDRYIYSEITSGKYYSAYRTIKPIVVQHHDIIHYKNGKGELKRLKFVKASEFKKEEKECKLHDIQVIINDTDNTQVPVNTLYSHINYGYIGKRFVYLDEYYEITKIEQSPKSVLTNMITDIKSAVFGKFTYINQMIKNLF